MTKVLAGCRVIENGTFITGPFAGMLLADLGAEVIKIERPDGGDPFRGFNQGGYSPQFQAYNRNKQSVAVDLSDPAERDFLREMIDTADVYLENFRPGAMDKLGLGPTALMSANPGLIYCSITGFGADGPAAHRPAYDTVAQGLSGYLSLFIDPRQPQVVGPAVADAITGMYAAYGILGALFERHRTGRGRLVEVSMVEAMAHFAVEQFHHLASDGVAPDRIHRARFSQSFAIRCGDSKLLALHLSSPPKFWEALVAAVGEPSLAEDPKFATRMDRVRNYEVLQEELNRLFQAAPRHVWLEKLEAADVPHAPILGIGEVLEEPLVRHLDIARSMTHPSQPGQMTTIRRPVTYDRARSDIPLEAPPLLDEHGALFRAALIPPRV
jgi:crotonobetainyl-CoA:carnitine CoA-transferase CaiB-like acyl-CoA transferase